MVREDNGVYFYRRLRSATSAASTCPLYVFPSAADADSVCALKIVRHMLNADNVRHSVYPVSSFGDIACPAIQGDEPLVVLLVNWGATDDLRRQMKLGPRVTVFVLDSRRPIHLNNLSSSNEQVVVLYTRQDEDVVYDFDVAALAEFSEMVGAESDSDSDEEEDEDEDDGDADGGNRKRRRDEDGDSSENFRRQMRRNRKLYYGMGSSYGRSAGCQIFEIAHALHVNTNELLWLACVSLTDQFVHERLTVERYQASVMDLENYVNSSGNLEMATTVTLRDGTVIRAPDMARITYEDEPRLMLLREWTLYDSMLCSSYVATKLKTWSDGGLKRMKLLLATMGIALVECQQKYHYMSRDTRRRMKDEFEKSSPQFGLTDLYYRGFQRLHGYSSKVSAADVVYGVTALLESEASDKGDQFWKAYSALSTNKWSVLQEGMQLAIQVQRAILRQGSLAITKQGFIRNGKGFRWLKLEDGPDMELLGHPMSLTKFCYFLMDALREQGVRVKPMICAVRCSQNTALLVGVSHRPRLGVQMGNRFGAVFRAVAQNLGVEYRHEGFESSWIRLDVAAVNAFMLRVSEKLPN